MTAVRVWTGREARALRAALRLSIRDYAAMLGVGVRTVTKWQARGEDIRLQPAMQSVLDTALRRADDESRERFELLVYGEPTPSAPASATSDDNERLHHALSRPGSVDLVAVAYLRERLHHLDAKYDEAPSSSLLGEAGQSYGQILFLASTASPGRVRRDLQLAEAESATLMGQLVWDASQRRDHSASMAYFEQAIHAAQAVGDQLAVARARLRQSYVALYGQNDPQAGLHLAAQAADVGRNVSAVIAGLALLHVAEAHAMLKQAGLCEKALGSAESRFDKITATDAAAELFSPTHQSRLAGSCYLFLEDPGKAQLFLTDALRLSAGRTKSSAVAAGNLSLAYLRQTKIAEAVAALHQAVNFVEKTRGGGGLNVAFAAGRALNPWRDQIAVRDVQDRLLALMTAA